MASCEGPEEKALILLEHEGQVRDCLRWLGELEGRKQIIALTPFAMYELDRHGVPYTIPEDYYEAQELYDIGSRNFQKVEEFCSVIDKTIQRAHSVAMKLGITPALFSFQHLKYVYDTLTNRAFQLSKVLNAEEPNVVLIHETKRHQFETCETAPYLLFDNKESVYAHLLALDGWNTEVRMLSPVTQAVDSYSEKARDEGFSDRVKRRVLSWLNAHPRLLDVALTIRGNGWHGSLDCLRGLLNKNTRFPVLLLGGAYNWNDCREEMRSQGIGPILKMLDDVQWLGKASEAKFEAAVSVWKELRNNREFRSFFIWREIDFFPLVEERLRFLVERLTPVCLAAFQEATELIRTKGIKAVISSTISTCVGQSVAQAAHKIGIPVITWQHGAYGTTHHPLINYADLMSSDVHFVFGEGVAAQYAESARKLNTRLVSVGSSMLQQIQKGASVSEYFLGGLHPGEKIVLYVTTNYYQSNNLISLFPPCSDNHLWRTQRAIADTLGKHSECSIVVKLHPNLLCREPPLRAYAEERGFRNFRFVRREHSFTELLTMAGIIVCDLPSTTLLQALTTSKPLFTYLGHQDMDEQARVLLERRAVCHRDLQSFTDALDEYVTTGNTRSIVDLDDREFLKRFGVTSSEGSAGNRAAKTLREILDAWEVRSNGDSAL